MSNTTRRDTAVLTSTSRFMDTAAHGASQSLRSLGQLSDDVDAKKLKRKLSRLAALAAEIKTECGRLRGDFEKNGN